MGMNYQTRRVGKVTILDIAGRLDVGVTLAFGEGAALPLQELVRRLGRSGEVNIVLNLRDVAYIDSTGIGDLVGCASTLRKLGGDLRIVNPSGVVQKLLSITRVDTVIEVKPDETSALEAFGEQGSAAKAL